MDIPDNGPIPTSFRFDSVAGYTLEGKTFEVTEPEDKFDEAFGFNIKTFSDSAEFRQKITSLSSDFTVTGAVEFMACNNATCLPPKETEFAIHISDNKGSETALVQGSGISDSGPDQPSRGLFRFFLISLLAGFAGVLTPCVFPMIPMTVAFFSQGSDNRTRSLFRAIVFGISIVIIYASLGIIVSLSSAGAGFASTLSTHWIPNTIFFLLFIVFAISFFGAVP